MTRTPARNEVELRRSVRESSRKLQTLAEIAEQILRTRLAMSAGPCFMRARRVFANPDTHRTCVERSTSCESWESMSRTRCDAKRLRSLRQNNTRKTRMATRISLHGASRPRKTETCDAHIHQSTRGGIGYLRVGEGVVESRSCINSTLSNAALRAWRWSWRTWDMRARSRPRDVSATLDAMA